MNSFALALAKFLKKARLSAIKGSAVHGTSKIEAGTSFYFSTMDRHSFCGYDCDIFHANIGRYVSIANGDDMVDFTRCTKLSVGLVDTNRIEIFDDYWDKLDPFSAVFGANYSGTVIETDHNNNPHILYIRTHSFFGLPATLLALLSPAIVLFGRKTRIAKATFFFIGMAALRAYSEPILFPTLLDFFYFAYFFIYFNHAPGRRAAA